MPDPVVQVRNPELTDLAGSDLLRGKYPGWSEPLGDFGIYNGQFEQGDPNDATNIEGWMVFLDATYGAGVFIRRQASGIAGKWCVLGGNTGTNYGSVLDSHHLIPVYNDRDYYVSVAAKGKTAASTFYVQILCYDAAKAYLGGNSPVSNVAPGAAWKRYERRIGPNGDVAFLAGTRYCRIRILLQWNNALTNDWVAVDDVQFQQMKAAHSSTLTLDSDEVTDTTYRVFTAAAWTQHVGSLMNLTLSEPGYIWVWYYGDTFNATQIVAHSHAFRIHINAAAVGVNQRLCSPNLVSQTYFYMPWALSYRAGPYVAGAYVIDMRVFVINGTDTVTVRDLAGSCFWSRQY